MDKAKRDLSLISHILAYCDEIEQTVVLAAHLKVLPQIKSTVMQLQCASYK